MRRHYPNQLLKVSITVKRLGVLATYNTLEVCKKKKKKEEEGLEALFYEDGDDLLEM